MKPKPIVEAQLPTYLEDTPPAKLLEGGMSFVRLGHIYYQMNQPFSLIVSVLSGLNLSEQSGLKSPSLVRSYASMCVVSGVLPRHDWAIAYRDRSHAIGRDVNDLPALSYALAGCAVYELGAARWEDASKSLEEAMEIDFRIGDMRHYDEDNSILSIVLFHQGEFRYGFERAAEILQRAFQRKDILPQAWAHMMRAEILVRQSKPDTIHEAILEYEEALKLLEQNIDLANQVRATGGLAFAYWRNGEFTRALDLAAATIKMAVGNPTAPYSMEGYAGGAEVFLRALEEGESKYRSTAKKSLKVMKKFASVFPVGQPRLQLYEGRFHWLDGKAEKARASWEVSLAEAQKRNMPYEQGRAYFYLGQYILSGEEKAKALAYALDLFTRFGIQYEAEVVKALIA